MRTILTQTDIKKILENIFIENSEPVVLINEDTGEKEQKDFMEYLNIKFYTWKNRVVDVRDTKFENVQNQRAYVDWLGSLNFSMNEAYALVEILDEEVTASQDIDSATKVGRITFLIQTNKIANLDYYLAKIKNKYLGVPQTIQNAYGDKISAFFMIGSLITEEEPDDTQVGEVVVVSCNFRIAYINSAMTYDDALVEISLDGDDNYDSNGNIVGNTKFLTMPITKHSWQLVFGENPMPTMERPDLTGFLATTLSVAKTLTFFDFNQQLTLRFNELFWGLGAYRIDGIKVELPREVNIPVFVRVTAKGRDGNLHTYTFKDMISQMDKQIINNDFTLSSITLKGWGKVE